MFIMISVAISMTYPASCVQIVLSTNIAETGVTIPDVVFVIDSGKTKENKWEGKEPRKKIGYEFIPKMNTVTWSNVIIRQLHIIIQPMSNHVFTVV